MSAATVSYTHLIESRGEKFIENFPQDYPSFELLEYVFGSAENAPIQLVAIARNKETGSSATLFVLDENGVGQVVLASGYSATYCKEDGLQLDKNVISISLNLEISSTNSEIHDFNITVTQEENQGKVNTVYLSLIHISPYSGKTGLQVCQFLVRQENILVTAIGAGGASLLYLSLYLYLFL